MTTGIVNAAAEAVLHAMRTSRFLLLASVLSLLGAARVPDETSASKERAPVTVGSKLYPMDVLANPSDRFDDRG